MIKTILAACISIGLALPAAAGQILSSVDPADLAKSRQTPLGLYLTARDTASALEADPGIVFIDVRTRAELSFVGYADPVDQNIPFAFLTGRFDEKRGAYALESNPNFVREVAALMAREGKGPDDPVFLICRSGARSASAVKVLAGAGFTRVFTVVDGFEGGKDKSTGHRIVDGWRNAGLPWGYKVTPQVAYQPSE